jgi:hypothetical protein
MLMTDHRTKTNPSGEVRQCRDYVIHRPHEYQGEFGAYFNVFCPGNDGKNKSEDEEETPLFGENSGKYVPIDRKDTLVSCNRCGAVVQGDVYGQAVHNIWHDNEGMRARVNTGTNLIA